MNKKESILTAALELLISKGVHNTPMSAIAKAAGTGMGTIYNYFPNKDVLINEIYIRIKEKEESLFLEVDTHGPIKTQFENYITVLINFFIEHPSYFKFLEQLQASPIITEENKQKGGTSVAMVATLLKSGQQSRIIKNIPIDELLMFIGGAVSSYLRWYHLKSTNKQGAFTNQIQMVWDAIKE
ncbi:TetR/AcrR family transcriptional regulator [Tenacibaculum sp. 190130A14a]|uniref:TetR/AcrR family transcriptional regulator, repressor of fatR-cypB operon n=1 Tax=Tenacibaculum polynesiense TaxID=3137857 RepID=A0ABP1F786_9FLAO